MQNYIRNSKQGLHLKQLDIGRHGNTERFQILQDQLRRIEMQITFYVHSLQSTFNRS